MPRGVRATDLERRRAYIAEHYGIKSRQEIAEALGMTPDAVTKMASALGVTASKHWTPQELARIESVYREAAGQPLDLAGLAAEMGRPRPSISAQARKMGLTQQDRPLTQDHRGAVSARMKTWYAENEHPFQEGRFISGKAYSRGSQGRRPDLENRYFRSSWEANYARYLNFLLQRNEIAGWEYESQTFWFEQIKRGSRSYTPDFKVTFLDGHHEWHEVKGYMDQKSRTKLARMKKYYPSERIVLVEQSWFRQVQRSGLSGLIPNWEKGGRRNAYRPE